MQRKCSPYHQVVRRSRGRKQYLQVTVPSVDPRFTVASVDLRAGLHSEALAMLDMMALAGAQHVVGFSASTFSWYLREIRCLLGTPVSVRPSCG